MQSRIAGELKLAYQPVAIIFTDEKPEGAAQFQAGRWGCVVAMLTAATKGKTAVFDRDTCGCGGGKVGLGFGDYFEGGPHGGIEYFLSAGKGEGYPPGERYKQSPELAKEFIESLPTTEIPTAYLVFKPLSAVDPAAETPQQVVFYANPDQLTALVVLANYGRPGNENVIIPWASGCQGIGIIPYHEAEQQSVRAVVGMVDVSARPFVDPDILSFTVPFPMFQEMESHVEESFLHTHAWEKVKARIPNPQE
jgi:uncharacterized protein (DUF169 family)